MRHVHLGWALPLVASSMLACSAPAPEADIAKKEVAPGEIVIEASTATRAELGVVEWRIDSSGTGTKVEGTDAEGSPRVRIATSWTKTGDSYHLEQRVQRDGASATLRVGVDRTGRELAIEVDNDLGSVPEAIRRTYSLFNADIARDSKGASLVGASSPVASLRPASLRPTDALVGCATTLVCRETSLACATNTGNVALECNPGSSAKKILVTVGKKLLEWKAEGGKEPFDPLRDCVDSVRGLDNCDNVDEACSPQRIKHCNESRDACRDGCSKILNDTCNYVGPDGVPGTGDDARSCDQVKRDYNTCMNRC